MSGLHPKKEAVDHALINKAVTRSSDVQQRRAALRRMPLGGGSAQQRGRGQPTFSVAPGAR